MLSNASSPLRYRRVYLEEKQLGQLVPKQRLLPIDRTKFATLLQAAQPENTKPHRSTTIESAVYQAHILPDNTLQGVADFQVAHFEKEASLLVLSPHSLSIKTAHWIDAQGKRSEAEWGTFNWSDAPKKTIQAVKVTHPGLLRITWSTAPIQQGSSELHFPLKLPLSVKSTCILDLPSKWTPSMKGGVLMKQEPVALGEKHYEFSLSSLSDIDIHLRTKEPKKQGLAGYSCRMETAYTISKKGLDISSVIQLDHQSAFLNEMQLKVDAECKIYRVLVNGQQTEWSVSRSKKNSPSLISIDLPREPQESVQIEIDGLGETPFGELFTLPNIHPIQIEVSRHSVSVILDGPLRVERLDAAGAIQMPTAELTNKVDTSKGQETKRQVFQYEKQSPKATFRLKLSANPIDISYDLTSAIFVGSKETNGTIVLQLPQEKNTKRMLRCRLAKNWIVDSIETDVPDGVTDWQQTGGDRLTILLDQIAAQKAKAIVIHARPYLVNQRDVFTSDALLPIQQIEGAGLNQKVYVHTAAGMGLVRITTDNQVIESKEKQEVDSLQALKLPPTLQHLLNISEKNHYQPLTLGVNEKWRIVRRKQSIQVNLLTTVLVEPSRFPNTTKDTKLYRVQQFLRIECIPQEASTREVTVEVSGTGASEIRWRLVGSDEPFEAESSRIVSVPGDLRERVRWVLRLDKVRSTPFQIEGQITKPFTDTTEVLLASIQNTLKQTGRIEINARPANAVKVQSVGLAARSLSSVDSNSVTKRIAEFGYDPTRDVGIYANAAVRMTPSSNTKTQALAIISTCGVSTYMTRSGEKRSIAHCAIENFGEDQFTCTLPAGAEARAIVVDGERFSLASNPRDSQQLSISLSKENRFSLVTIEYQYTTDSFGWVQEVQPHPPSFTLPVLKWSWNLWLPPNYTTECAQSTSKEGGRSMVQGLLGPLARVNRSASNLLPQQVSFLHQGWVHGKTDIEKPVVVVHRTTIFGLVLLFFLGGAALASSCWMKQNLFRIALLGVAGLAALLLPWLYAPCGTAVFVGAVLAWLLQGLAAAGRLFLGLRKSLHQRFVSRRKKTISNGLHFSLFILATSLALLLAASNHAMESNAPQMVRIPLQETPESPQRTNSENKNTIPENNSVKKKEINSKAVHDNKGTRVAKQSQLQVVYIPTDKNRKLVGDKVYLSETFYSELLKRVNQNSKPLGDWVLQKVQYFCPGLREQSNGSVNTWRLRYELETFAQNTTILLPFHFSDAVWEPFASLDGNLVPIRWSKDGKSCRVVVEEPGKYQLTFRCTPKTYSEGQNTHIQLNVPRISNATLELTKSKNGDRDNEAENNASITILGAAERIEDDDTLQVRLQNTDRLHINWKSANEKNTNILPTIARRQYMNIDSTGLQFIVQLNITPTEKALARLSLELPKSAEAIEWHIENATVESVGDSQPNNYTVHFKAPIEKPTFLQMQYRLPKDISIGKIVVPYVRILHSKIVSNAWGIFTAADWTCTRSRSDKETLTDPLLFVTGFNRTGLHEVDLLPHPQIAFKTSTPDATVRCTIWPKTPLLSVKETTSVTLHEESASLIYGIAGKTEQGSLLQLRLRVPQEGRIDHVRLFQAGIPVATKFLAHDRSGLLTLFLAKPLTGRFNLECEITTPLSPGKLWQVPHVTCLADKYEDSVLTLWRHPSVLVTLDQKANLTHVESTNERKNNRPIAYPIGSFSYNHKMPYELKLLTETNQPRSEAIVVSQLTHQGEAWKIEQSTFIETKSGQLDTVTLQVQDVWGSEKEPFLNNSKGFYRAANRSAEEKGMMKWTLWKTINQKLKNTPQNHTGDNTPGRVSQQTNGMVNAEKTPWQIKLQGSLRVRPDHTIDIPNVRLAEVPNLRHYITLPKAYFNLSRPWIIEGAIATNRPEGLQVNLGKNQATLAWYRVVSPTIRLVLPSSESIQLPSIKYAQVKVYQQQDHVYFDETFFISSESLPRFALQLQQGAVLTYLEVSGVAIPIERTSMNAWRAAHTVFFPPGPKSIRLLYKLPHNKTSADEPLRCNMPVFSTQNNAIPILKSLWEIHPLRETVVTASQGTPLHQRTASSSLFVPSNAMVRQEAAQKHWLATLNLFLEEKANQGDVSPESKKAWFIAWADLLAPAYLDLQKQLSKQNSNETEINNGSKAVTDSLAKWKQWLVENKMETLFRMALERAKLQQVSPTERVTKVAQYWFEPSAERLKLVFSPTRSTRTQRTTAVIIFLLTMGAMLPLKNFRRSLPQLRCYRCIAGLAAGLMWWLWLPPWWIGFLIVLGSIATFAATHRGRDDLSEC